MTKISNKKLVENLMCLFLELHWEEDRISSSGQEILKIGDKIIKELEVRGYESSEFSESIGDF